MLDRHALNTKAFSKCAHDVDWPASQLAGYRVLAVLREVQRDPNFASAHEIGDPRIGDLLRFGDCTSKLNEREEQARAECRENVRTLLFFATTPTARSAGRQLQMVSDHLLPVGVNPGP